MIMTVTNTFPVTKRHCALAGTKLYCLVTGPQGSEHLLGRKGAVPQLGVEHTTSTPCFKKHPTFQSLKKIAIVRDTIFVQICDLAEHNFSQFARRYLRFPAKVRIFCAGLARN